MNKISYLTRQPVTKPYTYYTKKTKYNLWQLLELPFLTAIKTLLGQAFCDYALIKRQENKTIGYKTIDLGYDQDLLKEIQTQALRYYYTTGSEATHVIIGHEKYPDLLYSINVIYAFRYLDYKVMPIPKVYNLKLVICPFIDGIIVLGDNELK